MIVGCFRATALSSFRWRVANLLTTHVHVTYGTEDEVRVELERQSALHEQRAADKTAGKKGKQGAAWRASNGAAKPKAGTT